MSVLLLRVTTAMSQTKSYRGVSRVLAKLEESVQAGKYYEAHQKYRTLYFRYLSQKRFDECLELLYTGAQTFLDNEQFSSGADLGGLVVDTLEKTTVPDNLMWMQRLGELIGKLKPTMVERDALLVSVRIFIISTNQLIDFRSISLLPGQIRQMEQ